MATPASSQVGVPVTSISEIGSTSPAVFTSLNSAPMQTLAHGLGRTPVILSAVVICIIDDTASSALTVGQQTLLESMWDIFDGMPPFGIACDNTNFYLSFPMAGQGSAVELSWNGGVFFPNLDNYKIAVYYA
jgi:hypothetical protein